MEKSTRIHSKAISIIFSFLGVFLLVFVSLSLIPQKVYKMSEIVYIHANARDFYHFMTHMDSVLSLYPRGEYRIEKINQTAILHLSYKDSVLIDFYRYDSTSFGYVYKLHTYEQASWLRYDIRTIDAMTTEAKIEEISIYNNPWQRMYVHFFKPKLQIDIEKNKIKQKFKIKTAS
ncbi:MAG: hypothetical protein MUE53_02225 [Chitinophagales bacterium]|nr:hypothetical protein [Chitinophagales bacterium]